MPEPAAANHPLTILHLDMDAFFAAVEVRDNPALRGQPVIVGAPPDQRGVVATCSYEARKFGVHSAMPSRTAYKLCPRGVFLPPRLERYAAVSRQIFAVLESFTPIVEPVSIDEAFLDVSGVLHRWPDAVTLARALKRAVHAATGLTASVGIAPNLFLAKLASDLQKPDGLTVVPTEPDAIRRFLAPLPAGKLWGVGKVTAATLAAAGLHTIGQIQDAPATLLARLLGPAAAAHLHELANGRDSRRVEPEAAPEKSIANEHTFPEDVADSAILRQTILELAEKVGRRLRASGRQPRTLHLKIRFTDFKTITRQTPLRPPATSDRDLIRHALGLWERQALAGRPIRLLGVGVTLAPASAGTQPLLFDLDAAPPARPAAKVADSATRGPDAASRLDAAVDELRQRYGRHILRRGAGRPAADTPTP
ncbi:MAG: DNA polymerase IV [Lentisphaeria bacterium]|jgi:nucleotidyltransferase/DNA polymerase involved in DNA repair